MTEAIIAGALVVIAALPSLYAQHCAARRLEQIYRERKAWLDAQYQHSRQHDRDDLTKGANDGA